MYGPVGVTMATRPATPAVRRRAQSSRERSWAVVSSGLLRLDLQRRPDRERRAGSKVPWGQGTESVAGPPTARSRLLRARSTLTRRSSVEDVTISSPAASTLGELREQRPRAQGAAPGDPRQPPRAPAGRRGPVAGPARLLRDRHPAGRARAARRPRHRAARRARPGQDPAAALAGRPARRVEPGDLRLRARRAPLRPDHGHLAAGRGDLRRRPAHLVAPPRREVRREAGDARTPRSPT